MIDTSTLLAFVIASVVLIVIPGPTILYITARIIEGGRVAGLVSAAGISAGGLVHVVFATVGLSAIVASSATAFSVVKWLGVAYLVYLGLSSIFGKDDAVDSEGVTEPRSKLASVFLQGAIVDALNPKVALFFLAFLPQFISPEAGAAWVQTASLGLIYVSVALVINSLYAVLGGTAGEWVRQRNRSRVSFRRGQRYLTGGIYLSLGVFAAFTGRIRN